MLRALGVHTDITHLKKTGNPVFSLIGLNGEPSYVDIDIEKVFPVASKVISAREREILLLLAKGKLSKEIAALLHISPLTVSKHRQNLLQKTNTKNTIELINFSIQNGYI